MTTADDLKAQVAVAAEVVTELKDKTDALERAHEEWRASLTKLVSTAPVPAPR